MDEYLNYIVFVFQYVPYKDDDYKKPFFFAYTKASMFTVYFLVYIIFKELRKSCSNQSNYMVILYFYHLVIDIQYLFIFYIYLPNLLFQFVNFDTIDDDDEDDNVFTDETERLVSTYL